MLKFYITIEERQRAHQRAAQLNLYGSTPPGQFPYVWDSRLGYVNRWYNYGSPEDKIGTICFDPITEEDSRLLGLVECTTEITHHPLTPRRQARHVHIIDPAEHKMLVGFFYRELLDGTRQAEETR